MANRQDRVIAGFSMGAYGATNIALHNLGVFASVQSWSGYYLQTRSGVFAHAGHGAIWSTTARWSYVRRLHAAIAADPLRAFLFVGRDDDDSPQLGPMARALAAAGGRGELRPVPRAATTGSCGTPISTRCWCSPPGTRRPRCAPPAVRPSR